MISKTESIPSHYVQLRAITYNTGVAHNQLTFM